MSVRSGVSGRSTGGGALRQAVDLAWGEHAFFDQQADQAFEFAAGLVVADRSRGCVTVVFARRTVVAFTRSAFLESTGIAIVAVVVVTAFSTKFVIAAARTDRARASASSVISASDREVDDVRSIALHGRWHSG